jgi:hypothetical protein
MSQDVIPKLKNEKAQLKRRVEYESKSSADAKSRIQKSPSEIFAENHQHLLTPYKEPWYLLFISIGLCFPVLIGVCELVGIQLNNLQEDKYSLLALCIVVACCLSIGAKAVMMWFAESSRRHEPSRSFPDDDRHPDLIPWWIRLAKGDGSLYLGFFFVGIEICFVTVGLIGILPPNLSDNPFIIITTIAGAALFATVNVSLGYIVGIHKAEQASSQREFYKRRNEIQDSPAEAHILRLNTSCQQIINQAEAKIADMTSEIESIDQEIELQERYLAKVEYDERTGKQPQDSANFTTYNPVSRSENPVSRSEEQSNNNHSNSRS